MAPLLHRIVRGVGPALLAGVLAGPVGCEGCRRAERTTTHLEVPLAGSYRRIDAHAHIMPTDTAEALQFYSRFGVEVAVNVAGLYPGRGHQMAADAAAASDGRLYFMCNIPWDLPVDHPDFVPQAIAVLERCRALGGVAWKIHKILGLAAVRSDGSLVPVDDPALDPVFERAGQLGMPVLIHSGDPVPFFDPPTPDNERYEELSAHPGWSFHGPEFPSWEEVFSQYERRIARHPSVTFIGAHFGNAPEDPQRVAAMLERYPNLYVDTAARVPELGRHDPREMHDLFVRYQDRILFATDLGFGRDMLGRRRVSLGSSGDTPPTEEDIVRFWSATYRYFETWDAGFPNPTPIQGRWAISGIGLPREVLEKLYHANAERVLGVRLTATAGR